MGAAVGPHYLEEFDVILGFVANCHCNYSLLSTNHPALESEPNLFAVVEQISNFLLVLDSILFV